MAREVPEVGQQQQPMSRQPARLGKLEAVLAEAMEQGQPAEKALALVGVDRVTGAKRILRALHGSR